MSIHCLIRNIRLHPIFVHREIIVVDIRIHTGVFSERPLPVGGTVASNIFMWFSEKKKA
jgi:hypothetical protein